MNCYLDTSELLTFPCCLPPRQSAQAGSPFVGALQNIFLFEICFLVPWQSHGRLLLKLSESHKSQWNHLSWGCHCFSVASSFAGSLGRAVITPSRAANGWSPGTASFICPSLSPYNALVGRKKGKGRSSKTPWQAHASPQVISRRQAIIRREFVISSPGWGGFSAYFWFSTKMAIVKDTQPVCVSSWVLHCLDPNSYHMLVISISWTRQSTKVSRYIFFPVSLLSLLCH